jgi:phosphoglycerol transferase MdoB-like AlkP superfamily enzyme
MQNGKRVEKKGYSAAGYVRTFLLLLAAGCFIGVMALCYAPGSYGESIFRSYFHHGLIVLLNLAPVILMVFFFYLLFGAPRAACITTTAIVMGLTFANYYLIRLRDDPLSFGDLLNIKEAISITKKQKYNLMPDTRMWIGIGCILLGVLILYLAVRHPVKIPFRIRLPLLLIPVGLLIPLMIFCSDEKTYSQKTVNNDAINRWSATQVYVSKGFVYPFLHSITSDVLDKPSGYNSARAKIALSKYQDADIPKEKKVSVVTVQLEAFADFSDTGVKGVDWEKAYGTYHQILKKSLSGRLLTNIFAGGTVNTERCFLTGFTQLKNFRSSTNSYARYFASQGYAVSGSHPSYGWFYNRKNINRYLGFPTYYFSENYYEKLADGKIASDSVLMKQIYYLYGKASQKGKPVFSFNVTYQGHGPYSDTEVWRKEHFTDGRYSKTSANILDNYLGSVKDTAAQLKTLLDQFEKSGDPVIVVLYGDHKPWLGDNNSVYNELKINLNASEEAGLYNKYSTQYVIWATSAAKKTLGKSFVGKGPDLSSNYLMNEVFQQCGWTGNAWMQATSDIQKTLPILTTVDGFSEGKTVVEESALSKAGKAALQKYRMMQYYWETQRPKS